MADESDLKFGADILWKPSGSFQLTAALNPDFGQVEADELVVNFDAIEVLFSDKRPFFAENQALFDVRLAGNDRLIYTRRVGGPRDDDPARAAEIDGAVKLNGTVGELDFGLLSAVESDYSDDIGRAFAAPRLRWSAGAWTVGYLGAFTDRPFFDRTAQVHATDFIWRPDERLSVQGQLLASQTEQADLDSSGDGALLQASFTPSPDWQHQALLMHLGGDLDFNDLGFQERSSLNRAFYSASRRYREFAASDRRAGVLWRAELELNHNDSGDRLPPILGFFREAQQRSGAVLTSKLELAGEGVDDLISRGNGNVNVDDRLVVLEQTYQSARIGKWRGYGRASLLQEGNDDYAIGAESKVEYFARADLSAALRVIMLWSRDWLIWHGRRPARELPSDAGDARRRSQLVPGAEPGAAPQAPVARHRCPRCHAVSHRAVRRPGRERRPGAGFLGEQFRLADPLSLDVRAAVGFLRRLRAGRTRVRGRSGRARHESPVLVRIRPPRQRSANRQGAIPILK